MQGYVFLPLREFEKKNNSGKNEGKDKKEGKKEEKRK